MRCEIILSIIICLAICCTGCSAKYYKRLTNDVTEYMATNDMLLQNYLDKDNSLTLREKEAIKARSRVIYTDLEDIKNN
jgi:hypothetical protein